VTVGVTDRLKGPSIPDAIVIKQLGGRAGNVGLRIEGQAAFGLGEHVLLFLTVRPRDGTLHTVRLALGKWQLLPDVDLNQLRALVASTPAPATPFVAVPREAMVASPAFTYFPTDDGIPARWHQADDNVDVPVDFQSPPAGVPGGQAELTRALSRWSNAGTRLRLDLAANQTRCAATFTGDRRITVAFNDPCGEITDDGTFGIGGGYYTTGDKRTINGTEFQAFIQGFAILNNAGPHLTSAGCFEDALTHKIGHAIGLGHSSAASAIMSASLPSGCSSGASPLGQDDVNGLRAIYPAVASGPNPPEAPVAFSASVALNTVTLQWTPASTGGPAETYLVEAGTGPGLANLVVFPVNAPQTSLVVNAVPTGGYWVRVRARNVMGTSGASPEAVVTVGTCPLPSAPRSFASTVSDTLVSLTWAAPTTGGPFQGYTLAVGSTPGSADLLVLPLPGSPTSFAASGVAYGDYHVRLYARNACGQSPPTPDILVRVQPCTGPPNRPTLAFTRTGNQVSFTWTSPPGGPAPSRYWIGAGTSSGNYNLFVMPTPDLTPAFSGTGPSGTYFVRVAAQNACGFSQLSNEVQVVIP
jgi:hypothetical protein